MTSASRSSLSLKCQYSELAGSPARSQMREIDAPSYPLSAATSAAARSSRERPESGSASTRWGAGAGGQPGQHRDPDGEEPLARPLADGGPGLQGDHQAHPPEPGLLVQSAGEGAQLVDQGVDAGAAGVELRPRRGRVVPHPETVLQGVG